jgi:hypothetical protein
VSTDRTLARYHEQIVTFSIIKLTFIFMSPWFSASAMIAVVNLRTLGVETWR